MPTTSHYQIRRPALPRRIRNAGRRGSDAHRFRYRFRRGGALAAAIAAVALGAMPSLASAQPLYDISIDTDVSGGSLVLDVNAASTAPGAPIIQWYRNGGSNQQWTIVRLADGNERIFAIGSQMCLTSDGVAGHWVYQWPCQFSDPHQEWVGDLDSLWSSRHALMNVASGLYLDVDGNSPWPGAHLITWYWDATSGEAFGY